MFEVWRRYQWRRRLVDSFCLREGGSFEETRREGSGVLESVQATARAMARKTVVK